MKIKFFIILIFLCGIFVSANGFPLPNQEDSAQESDIDGKVGQDAIKARMLYHMAVWKWKYQSRKTSELPKLDSSGVDAFIKSVKKGDKDGNPAGIYTVYNKTVDKLGKTYFSSSPEEVAAAIEETLKEKYSADADSEEYRKMLANVNELAQLLHKDDELSPNLSLDLDLNSGKTVTTNFANHATTKINQKDLNLIESHPYWFTIGGLILGLLLGGGLVWLVERNQQKYLNARIGRRDNSISLLKNEINTLKNEKTLITGEYNRLANEAKIQNGGELKSKERVYNSSEDSTLQYNGNISSQPKPLVINQEPEPTPKVEPERKFYAPAAEDPYIEQSKMYLTYSGAAAVMLTIDSQDPERAEFEFSPYADQAHIINTSITQLDQFFEYTLPSRGFSKITSAGKGTLQLENGYWVRKKKARLELQ
jgi:hypothetical protein